MLIRSLTVADLEPFLACLLAHNAESGRDGDPYFGPYGHDDVISAQDIAVATRRRWTTPVGQPGWRRAWGLFDGARIVGSGDVAGGTLPTGSHRVDLGMGLLREARAHGDGRRLLDAMVGWCRKQPSIDWIDLGVIGENAPATALYLSAGFEQVGCWRDRWRIDGVAVDETAMMFWVGD